jgi:uncharacterized small protein (DUF1192 family)
MTDEFVQQKIGEFGVILQKFGLQFIQSIGEMKHQISILTDKVERIENELVDFKGIKTQLQEFDRFRRDVLDEFNNIKGPLRTLINKFPDNSTPKPTPVATTKGNPKAVIEETMLQVQSTNSVKDLKTLLDQFREKMYLITGGHRMLMDMREFDRKIRPNMDLADGVLKAEIIEKLKYWSENL